MASKFKRSIGKARLQTLIGEVIADAGIPQMEFTMASTPPALHKGEPMGCCAIVVNTSVELRPTTKRVCDVIEEQLDGNGSTQWFEDPCKAW